MSFKSKVHPGQVLCPGWWFRPSFFISKSQRFRFPTLLSIHLNEFFRCWHCKKYSSHFFRTRAMFRCKYFRRRCNRPIAVLLIFRVALPLAVFPASVHINQKTTAVTSSAAAVGTATAKQLTVNAKAVSALLHHWGENDLFFRSEFPLIFINIIIINKIFKIYNFQY